MTEGRVARGGGKVAPPSPMWPMILCSLGAGLNALSGLGRINLAHGWRNDVLAGGIQAIGAMALVPPILEMIRARFPQTKPRWVPVVYAFALGPVATLVGLPFAPSPAQKVQLRISAVNEAKTLLAHGQALQAILTLDKYKADHDVSVDRLLGQANAKKAAIAVSSSGASAIAASTGTSSAIPELHEALQSPGSAYAERVRTYWLPAAKALPDAVALDDESAVGKIWPALDELLQHVEDGGVLGLSPKEEEVRRQLIQVIARKQATLFPSMRRNYARALRARLFRDDVEVAATGAAATTLRQTGGAFSLNANIDDDAKASQAALNRLRFHRSEYRWSRFINDGYNYDFKSPRDDAVMQWFGVEGEWKLVSK